jgi:hypothetical protein
MRDARLNSNTELWIGQTQLRERAQAAFRQLGDPTALLAGLVRALAEPDFEATDLPAPLAGDVNRFHSGVDGIPDGSWFGIATALAMRACTAPSVQTLTS